MRKLSHKQKWILGICAAVLLLLFGFAARFVVYAILVTRIALV